jgi:hypothetical protein
MVSSKMIEERASKLWARGGRMVGTTSKRVSSARTKRVLAKKLAAITSRVKEKVMPAATRGIPEMMPTVT